MKPMSMMMRAVLERAPLGLEPIPDDIAFRFVKALGKRGLIIYGLKGRPRAKWMWRKLFACAGTGQRKEKTDG